jgi:hypothetical protein
MGALHFKQMFDDAFDVDRRALHRALTMRMSTQSEHTYSLGNPWEKLTCDRVMDLARKLLALDAGFTERLKLMLLEGELTVFIPLGDKVHRVRDPSVIDFDDPALPAAAFYVALCDFLDGKIRSGEQD